MVIGDRATAAAAADRLLLLLRRVRRRSLTRVLHQPARLSIGHLRLLLRRRIVLLSVWVGVVRRTIHRRVIIRRSVPVFAAVTIARHAVPAAGTTSVVHLVLLRRRRGFAPRSPSRRRAGARHGRVIRRVALLVTVVAPRSTVGASVPERSRRSSTSESSSRAVQVVAAIRVGEFVRLGVPRSAVPAGAGRATSHPFDRRVPRIVVRERVKLVLVLVGPAAEEPEPESGEDGENGDATDDATGDRARVA